ncbi:MULTISPECIES: YopX family protein [unclassified Staphylococcus]|uniref:YopX family protein n=1 Tax=unclassified Staphylococcus TaxID=91994 RepID=UPI00195219D7|nr:MULTISPECIES: YopX family protein [unclassified Staphylococcus]
MVNLKFRAYLKERPYLKGTGIIVDVQEINYKYEEIIYESGKYKEVADFKDVELLQSTRLFDLDGNEIYIGDILKMEDEYTQVVFHEDNSTYGVYLEDKEGGGNPISDYSTRISLNHIKGTIKGNQFQHPHLLEE